MPTLAVTTPDGTETLTLDPSVHWDVVILNTTADEAPDPVDFRTQWQEYKAHNYQPLGYHAVDWAPSTISEISVPVGDDASAVTLGDEQAIGTVVTYRELSITDDQGTRTLKVPVDGWIRPVAHGTGPEGEPRPNQHVQPRYRCGDIQTFTFTA